MLPAPVPATPATSPKELDLDKVWTSHPCHAGHSQLTDGHCQQSASALGGLQGASAVVQEPICTPCPSTSHSHPDLTAANASRACARDLQAQPLTGHPPAQATTLTLV